MATYVYETFVEIFLLEREALHKTLSLLVYLLPIMLLLCSILLALCAILLLLICRVIRRHGRSQLPHLREADSRSGKVPRVVAFFHPYCNAGGGGERVLWTAVRAVQRRYPDVRCVIYTGDTDVTAADILQTASNRLNITLPHSSVEFVFLHQRSWVEASRYPHFTLLGQSIGSMILGMEALLAFTPDVFIDTMGYAFTLPLFKYIGGCQVACYVHYPTISTDMLERVQQRVAAHNNAGAIAQSSILSSMKLLYYHIFAYAYGVAGKRSDVIMVNSSWTRAHIDALWQAADRTHTVYPPCDTQQFLAMPLHTLNPQSDHIIASIAQFRPEKDHPLQLRAFHKFLSGVHESDRARYTLLLVGSCRNDDDEKRVDDLRNLTQELDIEDRVQFRLNVPFSELKQCLNSASIGLHTMWNEHFGIGVVECMAAGSIILAHQSGGPLMDIVIDYNGERTGFLADSVETYAAAMKQILSLSSQQRTQIQHNARQSVERFSEENFDHAFLESLCHILPVQQDN